MAAAAVGQYSYNIVVNYMNSRKANEAVSNETSQEKPRIDAKKEDEQPEQAAKKDQKEQKEQAEQKDGEGTSFFSSWFVKGFYEGGFEEKMTKREAALILGVRESATPERIKEAHRRILILNHPDRGGSALIAAKVNEAKDLLMKGK